MRKITFLLLAIVLLILGCHKKDPYKIIKPESAVWNPVTKSYLISNAGSGIILSLLDKYKFDIFNKFKLISPKGMAIRGNTVYIADVYRVVGLDLKTGKKTFIRSFSKASFLNDVDTAPDGRIFASDTQNNYLIIITPGNDKAEFLRHKKLYRPNGLYYVKTDSTEQIYITSFRQDAKVQVMDLKTREVTDVPNTDISMADGICRDKDNFWLVSSWADSTIYRFNPDFTERTKYLEKYNTPADISYSFENKELVIPHFEQNEVSFITKVDSVQTETPKAAPPKKK